MGAGENQFLTFVLEQEEYAVDILRVQEIRGWESVTRIPNTPEYIRGVLNLRGAIVPIVDLRMRFNMKSIEYGVTTVIVVLKVMKEDGSGSRTMGIVVDGVSEVYSVPESEIKEAPDFGTKVRTEFIKGLATIDDKMVIIIDIDKMLNSDELAVVDSVSESTGQIKE
ncbi:MAG: chemotaxis protein CheW [Gammaproteobacteria bacterium]|nr:chemotaxis protein CheW [Gammaproteobacteria bacterium]